MCINCTKASELIAFIDSKGGHPNLPDFCEIMGYALIGLLGQGITGNDRVFAILSVSTPSQESNICNESPLLTIAIDGLSETARNILSDEHILFHLNNNSSDLPQFISLN